MVWVYFGRDRPALRPSSRHRQIASSRCPFGLPHRARKPSVRRAALETADLADPARIARLQTAVLAENVSEGPELAKRCDCLVREVAGLGTLLLLFGNSDIARRCKILRTRTVQRSPNSTSLDSSNKDILFQLFRPFFRKKKRASRITGQISRCGSRLQLARLPYLGGPAQVFAAMLYALRFVLLSSRHRTAAMRVGLLSPMLRRAKPCCACLALPWP